MSASQDLPWRSSCVAPYCERGLGLPSMSQDTCVLRIPEHTSPCHSAVIPSTGQHAVLPCPAHPLAFTWSPLLLFSEFSRLCLGSGVDNRSRVPLLSEVHFWAQQLDQEKRRVSMRASRQQERCHTGVVFLPGKLDSQYTVSFHL